MISILEIIIEGFRAIVAVESERLVIAGMTMLSGFSPRSNATWAIHNANNEIIAKPNKLHNNATEIKKDKVAP